MGEPDPLLDAAADELDQLQSHASRGAWQVDQLKPLGNVRRFLQQFLPIAALDLSDERQLYELLVTIDEYAQKYPMNDRDAPGRQKSSTTNIVQAVGIMIRLYDNSAYPAKLEERWQKAATTVGFRNRRSVRPDRNNLLYRRKYLGYIRDRLRTPKDHAVIIEFIANRRAKVLTGVGTPAVSERGIYGDLDKGPPPAAKPPVALTQALPDWLSLSGQGSEGPPILERTADLADIQRWITSGGRVLLLAGDSGNGKSTLAKKSLENTKPSIPIVYVDFANVHSLTRTINFYLPGLPILNVKEAIERFTEFVAKISVESPNCIVYLDNVADFSEIRPIVVWSARTLITAEERIIPNDFDYSHRTIDVGPLPAQVAQELVIWFRTDEALESVERFVKNVGRKPRIIIDCLGMFAAEDLTLAEMSNLIEDEQARLIQQSGIGDRAVHKLYQRYFDELEGENMVGAMLLACIAHLSLDTVPFDVCSQVLIRYAQNNPEYGRMSAGAVKVHCKPLSRRYLITQDMSAINIHRVTAQLFRDVTKEYRTDIVQSFVDSYIELRHRVEKSNSSQSSPYLELIPWAPPLCIILRNLPSNIIGNNNRLDMHVLVHDMHVGMAHIGRIEDAITTMARYTSTKHTPKGGPLELLDAMAVIQARYEFGLSDREGYVRGLVNLLTQAPQTGAKPMILLDISRALYKIREYLDSPDGRLLLDAMDEHEKITKDHLAVPVICAIYESVGHGRKALQIVQRVELDESSALPAQRAKFAASMVCLHSRLGKYQDAGRWYDMLLSLREYPQIADSKLYASELATAYAWYLRTGIHNEATATEASDAFISAAQHEFENGHRRAAADLYTESAIIDLICAIRVKTLDATTDDVHRKNLELLLYSIDEPHLLCRLATVNHYIAYRNDKTQVHELENITAKSTRSDHHFQDARGYRLGLGAQILVLKELGTHPERLRKVRKELVIQLAAHRELPNDELNRLVETSSASDLFLLRI